MPGVATRALLWRALALTVATGQREPADQTQQVYRVHRPADRGSAG
jgi:hypothetical protein